MPELNPAVRYVAEPKHVREVSLLGAADLAFWRESLKRENLVPLEHGGRAQIWIIGGTMKFMGVAFTEISFSVLVSRPAQAVGVGAAFLFQAFNSCAAFAFCERVLFATPYLHGECELALAPAARLDVRRKGELAFRARMGPGSGERPRQPSRSGEEPWEGAVFLPGRRGAGKYFFSRIRGPVFGYRFEPEQDSVAINSFAESATLDALLQSGFTPAEWLVRPDAAHGKSRTYRR